MSIARCHASSRSPRWHASDTGGMEAVGVEWARLVLDDAKELGWNIEALDAAAADRGSIRALTAPLIEGEVEVAGTGVEGD